MWVDASVWEHVTAPALLVAWFTVYSVSWVAYSIVCHGLYGQTIGKKLVGIRVLDVSESRLSMRQAVTRDSVVVALLILGLSIDLPAVASGKNPYAAGGTLTIAQWISLYATFGWFLVELITMLANEKRRAVHDYLAGSVVVRAAAENSARAPAIRA
jgi:uncharacterized RDD family membrane protein YckC